MTELSRDPGQLFGIALLVCVTWVLAGLPPTTARAGSLQLDAPAGARVSIDGRNVGVVPLPSSLLLEPGPHLVRLDLAGAHSATADLEVGPDDAIVHLTMRMVPKSRANATARSVLLAGLGQQYLERRKLGWALTAAEVGAVAVAGLAQLQFEQSKDDFNEARELYATLVDPALLAAARADADNAYDDMGSAESLRNAALLVAGAAVLASALDAWFHFPQLELALGSTPPGDAHVGAQADRNAMSLASARGIAARGDTGLHLSLRAQF